MTDRPAAVTVNGRTYAWPREPLVVVCMDGTDPAYLDAALAAGGMPWLARTLEHGGTGLTALAAGRIRKLRSAISPSRSLRRSTENSSR